MTEVAAVMIDDRGDVPVVKRRDNGDWQVPGGILEPEESAEAGVPREILEETGVVVQPERLTSFYKNLCLGVVVLVFRSASSAAQPSRPRSQRRPRG